MGAPLHRPHPTGVRSSHQLLTALAGVRPVLRALGSPVVPAWSVLWGELFVASLWRCTAYLSHRAAGINQCTVACGRGLAGPADWLAVPVYSVHSSGRAGADTRPGRPVACHQPVHPPSLAGRRRFYVIFLSAGPPSLQTTHEHWVIRMCDDGGRKAAAFCGCDRRLYSDALPSSEPRRKPAARRPAIPAALIRLQMAVKSRDRADISGSLWHCGIGVGTPCGRDMMARVRLTTGVRDMRELIGRGTDKRSGKSLHVFYTCLGWVGF